MKKIRNVLIITAALMMLALSAGCGAGGTDAVPSRPETQTAADNESGTDKDTVTQESGSAVPLQKSVIRIGGLKGPTSMGMVKLLEDAENGECGNDYVFTMAGSADELTPLLLKGELDIIAAPVNLGSVLYHRSNGAVQLLAVNTLGVVYIVEKGGEEINSLDDLKGRTIYATGKGSTPEYALTYLLARHGMDIGTDVAVEWKSEPTEIVAAFSVQETGIAMLPQPYVTVVEMQMDDVRTALDLTAEWNRLDNGSGFVTAGLIIRKAFAEENPEAVKGFLEEYERSADYVNDNIEEASRLMEKFDIVKAAVAKKAIPGCNIVCITGEEMKNTVKGFLSVIAEQNSAFIGDKLPGEDFYLIYE